MKRFLLFLGITLACSVIAGPMQQALLATKATTSGGGGWWTSGGISAGDVVAAFQPKGAASLAASYANLNNPGTHDAVPGNAPNFNTSTGWEFVSANSDYVDSSVIPVANMTVIVRLDGVVFASVQERSAIGYYLSTAVRLGLQPTTGIGGSEFSAYSNAGAFTDFSGGVASGVMAVAGQNAYLNGSGVGTTSDAFSGTASQTMLIGARRREDTTSIDLYSNITIVALAIYSRVLTSGEIAAVTSAMNAL